MLHRLIVVRDDRLDAVELFIARDLYQVAHDLGAQAAALKVVADNHAKASHVRAVKFGQTAGSQNLALARLVFLLSHQRHFAVIVAVANVRKPLVPGALA